MQPEPLLLDGDPRVFERPDLYGYASGDPIGLSDADGRLGHIAAGAGGGALWGAGQYLVSAAVTGDFSWGGLARAGVEGALSGAVTAATGGLGVVAKAGATFLGDLAGNFAGELTEQAVDTGTVDATAALSATADKALELAVSNLPGGAPKAARGTGAPTLKVEGPELGKVPEPKGGKIYKVPGDKTPSGKPYIGRTRQESPAKRGKSDGRDRSDAEIVDTYDPDVPSAGAVAEQRAMNNAGGVEKLDNKRNEIRADDWESKGVDPPK